MVILLDGNLVYVIWFLSTINHLVGWKWTYGDDLTSNWLHFFWFMVDSGRYNHSYIYMGLINQLITGRGTILYGTRDFR